ncbi:MAG: hypothetical protein KDD40_11925, partial [Bdellovibrionales bacterium]|nr:hypothetical protein [Bdellovibrionales bacterium]
YSHQEVKWYEGFTNSFAQVFIRNNHRLELIFSDLHPDIDNSSAAARYDSLLNRILLKEDYYWPLSQFQMKPVAELLKARMNSKLSYLFHEVSHAELDFLVEESATNTDHQIWLYLNNPVKKWIQKIKPQASTRKVIDELFAYFRQELIRQMTIDFNNIITTNGINPFTFDCQNTPRIINTVHRLPNNEKSKLQIPSIFNSENQDLRLYFDRMENFVVYFNGHGLPISFKQDSFLYDVIVNLWLHFLDVYDPPTNTIEMVERLNSSDSIYFRAVQKCRAKISL